MQEINHYKIIPERKFSEQIKFMWYKMLELNVCIILQFSGYDVGNNLIHVSGITSTLFPSDGGEIRTEKTEFVQGKRLSLYLSEKPFFKMIKKSTFWLPICLVKQIERVSLVLTSVILSNMFNFKQSEVLFNFFIEFAKFIIW